MASQGAVRRHDGTNFWTVGHHRACRPQPAALTLLATDAEDGQTVFSLSDSTVYVYSSAPGSMRPRAPT